MAHSNIVFFGCNYNDKKIKGQFDSLKYRIENDTALSCIVIDKRSGKSASDLWQDIRLNIEDSAACVFDVTGFRPNVVLELGYALSIKAGDQVFITFRKRKSKGKTPMWLLSDIGHLNRLEYINVPTLENFVREQLDLLLFSKYVKEYMKDCKSTNAVEKYQQYGLKVLQAIRDNGSQSEQQLQALLVGSSCRLTRMLSLLKKHQLIRCGVGRNGKYSIPELPE
ncbi:MAG: hypothetical protein MUO30_10020 [Anaerolineales bacterium]|nr:hypothetical protein [Anaerolineales bacterium]